MILPAVLEIDPKKQIQRMEELGKYSSIIHTDIMDGKFVKGKNLNVLRALAKYQSGVDLELHLMVREPVKLFERVRKIKKVKRVVLPIESYWEPALVKYKKYYQVGISLKPETPISVILNLIQPACRTGRDQENKKTKKQKVYFVQLLSVIPGAQGNPFRQKVYKRVREVKKMFPKTQIEIDGAMNPARIKKLKKLGAKDFVVGSFLKSGKVENKFKKLFQVSSQT